MSSKRRRHRPSDPQEIAEDRRAGRTPGEWGNSADIVSPTSSRDVEVIAGTRGRLIHARRSDPFDLLHRAGGLSDHQSAGGSSETGSFGPGVRHHERLVLKKVDETARIGLVNDAMIDAAKRIEGTRGQVGRANAKWLSALIAPKQPPVYVTGHQAEVI